MLKLVKLLSTDNNEFFISKSVAEMSPVIASKLKSLKKNEIEIKLPFDSIILEIIIDFLHYKKKYLHLEKEKPEFIFDHKKSVEILKASLKLKI